MPFKIFPQEDDLIHIQFIGDFDDVDAIEYEKELETHQSKADMQGKKLNCYVDGSKFKSFSVEARRSQARLNADPRIGNIAVTGASRIVRIMAQFVLIASGRKNIRIFNTKDEAMEWLTSSNGAKRVI